MHVQTAESVRAALFIPGTHELRPADRWRDMNRDWADPATFDGEPETPAGHGLRRRAARGGVCPAAATLRAGADTPWAACPVRG